ncbi:MFS transporter [Deinococcus hopiensis]|uniref:MFS-type transporter involved in bile tolerance, Atg22 family n=1 Tax=Deinococcus hopiensis KR-140 TaxID=695939 RepID=A0A1W1V955_9DEIO|nr:MFS transporter [Deinococcus hopiensis]SMB89892.1 MFS-type transporter involved in bile tolerance, Atg22 family [Deinococcus hopiensis KR-140]
MTASAHASPTERQRWRTFMWLWGSQALSVLGSGVSGFALNIYLTQTRFPHGAQRAELAAALSLTALGWTFAALLGAPLAGALADRLDRRRMMLTCDLLSALTMGAALALVTLGTPPIWGLVSFTATLGLIGAFHGSAFDTGYSALVPKTQLPRANGMMQTVWSLSGLLSPALAALLIGLPALVRSGGGPGWLGRISDGVPFAFALDGGSFLLAGLVVWRLSISTPPRADLEAGQPQPSVWADMRFGWTYIFARPPLLHLLGTFAVVNLLLSGTQVLHPLLVRFALLPNGGALGLSAQAALAALWTSFSVGGVLGGVVVSTWGGLKRRRVLGVLVPVVVAGAAQAASGAAGSLVAVCVAVAACGMMTPVMNSHSQAIWQAQVPPQMQGRVFSVRRLIAQFTSPVSTAVAGLLAARCAAGGILLWSGLLLMGLAAAQLLNPVIRRVEEPLAGRPVGAVGASD